MEVALFKFWYYIIYERVHAQLTLSVSPYLPIRTCNCKWGFFSGHWTSKHDNMIIYKSKPINSKIHMPGKIMEGCLHCQNTRESTHKGFNELLQMKRELFNDDQQSTCFYSSS